MAHGLEDAEPLLRRHGLGPPLIEASGAGGVSAAVCLARADSAPWLVVASRDRAGQAESTAAPILERFGTCLSDEVLVVGGVAAHAGGLIACRVDGIEQRVRPTPERAWVAILAPVAAPARLTVQELAADGEILGAAEVETGPDPTEPRAGVLQRSRAGLRRLRSGRFPAGRASY